MVGNASRGGTPAGANPQSLDRILVAAGSHGGGARQSGRVLRAEYERGNCRGNEVVRRPQRLIFCVRLELEKQWNGKKRLDVNNFRRWN